MKGRAWVILGSSSHIRTSAISITFLSVGLIELFELKSLGLCGFLFAQKVDLVPYFHLPYQVSQNGRFAVGMSLFGQESSPRFHACFSFFRLRLDEVDASSRGRAFERRCLAVNFYRQAVALICHLVYGRPIWFVFRGGTVKSRYSCYSVAVCRGLMGL